MWRVSLIVALFVALLSSVPTLAQDDEGATAGIYVGSCNQELRVPAAPLPMPSLPVGEKIGSAEARPAAVSFSIVPLALDELLGSDYVVAIVPDGDTAPLVCGAIGGVLTPSDTIIIELSEFAGSGLSGISYIFADSDDAKQTDVSIFLVGLGAAAAEPSPATDNTNAPGSTTAGQKAAGAPSVTPTETATVAATEVSTATASDNAVTYVSPNYGFTLTYDSSVWSVSSEPASENDIDSIGLSTSETDILVAAFSLTGDARDCTTDLVDNVSEKADVVSTAPLLQDGVPVAGGDAHDSVRAIVLTRTREDESTFDQAVYTRCLELVPGESMLAMQQWSEAADYDVAARQREDLLSGLELP